MGESRETKETEVQEKGGIGGILSFVKEEKWEILKLVMLIAVVVIEMKAEKKKLTKKAWKAAKKEYKEGRKAGDRKLHLKHSSKTYYMAYIEAGKKADTYDELTDLQKQRLKEWGNFLEIYKNSFPEKARL